MNRRKRFLLDQVDGHVCVWWRNRRKSWEISDYAVRLGDLGSWHSSGCYFDTYIAFMAMVFLDGSGLFQQTNAPCHTFSFFSCFLLQGPCEARFSCQSVVCYSFKYVSVLSVVSILLLTQQKCSGMDWGTWQRVKGVALASKFPRSQSDWVSMGCAGLTNLIHEVPTSQLARVK